MYVRVVSGTLKRGTNVTMYATNKSYELKEVGIFTPKQARCESLVAGDVGYVVANMKSTSEVKIGDTIMETTRMAPEPLPGFKEIQPMVYSGIYPVSSDDFEPLKLAMGKLQINDSAFRYQQESSAALGFGFRCGFLGLLHMEIVVERLRREYNMDIISTYPSVVYEITLTNGEELKIDNPTYMPYQADLKICHHVCKRDFLWLKFESEEKAQLASHGCTLHHRWKGYQNHCGGAES
jgi:GTP-binding protein LepA